MASLSRLTARSTPPARRSDVSRRRARRPSERRRTPYRAKTRASDLPARWSRTRLLFDAGLRPRLDLDRLHLFDYRTVDAADAARAARSAGGEEGRLISDVENPGEPTDKEYMATLAKGLAVIRIFGADRPRVTLSQAAAAVGLSRATARRVLRTLAQLGYVAQEGRDFSSPRVLELGFSYLAAQSWIDRALPLMKALSEDIAETCSASVLQGSEIVFVARVPTRRIMSSAIAVGARLRPGTRRWAASSSASCPMRTCAAGCAPRASSPTRRARSPTCARCLSESKEDRERGFSIVDEELEKGLRSISVALTTRRGRPVGAIDVSVHANRTTRNEMRELFPPATGRYCAPASRCRRIERIRRRTQIRRRARRIFPLAPGTLASYARIVRSSHVGSIIEHTLVLFRL